jgi:hypothetical protein
VPSTVRHTLSDSAHYSNNYQHDVRRLFVWCLFSPSATRHRRNRPRPRGYPQNCRSLRPHFDLKRASSIEFQTIREFRRRLRDPQYHRAHEDTLYCLALMRHHFAPTRLLDCTYSPFVAAAFAIENGIFSTKDASPKTPVVWCFNGEWCEKEAKRSLPLDKRIVMIRRNKDALRNNQTFTSLFQLKTSRAESKPRWKFVKVENPLHLNERLTAQQGAFLCPANIEISLEDNIKEMRGCYVKTNVLKLCLQLDKRRAEVFARNLKHMNISFAALFPGLDGFAKSINQQIVHYDELDLAGL